MAGLSFFCAAGWRVFPANPVQGGIEPRETTTMRLALTTLPVVLLLGACAAVPQAIVVPAAAGRSADEVSRLVAASDAKLFPCYIHRVSGADGKAVELGSLGTEVTLPPAGYQVTLLCTNNAGHKWDPSVQFTARPGKRYQVTGYFIDDSITVFNMKMRAKVAELP